MKRLQFKRVALLSRYFIVVGLRHRKYNDTAPALVDFICSFHVVPSAPDNTMTKASCFPASNGRYGVFKTLLRRVTADHKCSVSASQ